MIDGHMVVDPPLSDKKHTGVCKEKDHYRHISGTENFLRFFEKVKTKFPTKILCFPELPGPTGYRKDNQIEINWKAYSIIKEELIKEYGKVPRPRLFIRQHLPSGKERVLNISKEIKLCIKRGFRFICLDIDLMTHGKLSHIGHANVVIIDTKKKTAELFEPHGGRDNIPNWGWYEDISFIFQDFFENEFPDYTYVPPHKFIMKNGPQGRLSVTGIGSGLCMSWCSLYLHYKLLNPEIPSKVIVKRLTQLNQTFMKRYLQYVEDVIKGNETEFRMYRRAESYQPKRKQISDDSQVNQQTIQKVEDPKKSQSI